MEVRSFWNMYYFGSSLLLSCRCIYGEKEALQELNLPSHSFSFPVDSLAALLFNFRLLKNRISNSPQMRIKNNLFSSIPHRFEDFCCSSEQRRFTYILFPRDPFCGRERINCAFKVNIIPFTNIYRIQFRAQLNADLGRVCKKDRREMVNNQTFNRLPIHALPIMPKALFLLIPIDVCAHCAKTLFLVPKEHFRAANSNWQLQWQKSDRKRRLFF